MWQVIATDTFNDWLSQLGKTDRARVLAGIYLLKEKGPHLARPYADTVEGSEFSNMKELRIQSRGDHLGHFLYLTQQGKAFCCVRVIRLVTKNVFINACSQLLIKNIKLI